MTVPEHAAAKMRQLLLGHNMVPNEAGLELAWLVVSTRPWPDERGVANALRSWAGEFSPKASIDRGNADGAGQVAEHLRALGSLQEPLDDGSMIFITLGMLRNVAAGRAPAEYDLLRDQLKGFPERTLRRYRQRVAAAGGNPGLDALHDFLEAFQYDLDVAGLVRKGRTPAAARRWLERNPGKHAHEAPPPRVRRTRRES